jgi:alcohol dehydrogenase (quinone), cytochrome c subunit
VRGGRLRALLGLALFAASVAAQAADPSVERGRYLATAGNCVSCHTRPGGAPFAGGVAFETPFGTIYSTNITPDMKTGIGSWSGADLRRAMHEGIAADGSRLFPAFPYPQFTKVTEADVADIYAYLRTLKPESYEPPSNGVLLRMRWPLALWNRMNFTPGRFVADRSKSTEWNRGAYLVESLGHCSACHTPRDRMLAAIPEKMWQGGVIQGEVAPGKNRSWFAVNLTSAKHGLGAWSATDIVKYLRTGFSGKGGTFGPMNEVIMNSTRHLTPEDLQAMAVYVKSLEGPAYDGEVVSPELAAQGAALYKKRCEKCHGDSGRGGFFSGPPLAGSAVVQAEDPSSLINIIIHGPTVPKDLKLGAWETMPSYGDVLSDAEVVALSNFLRGSWDNKAAPVALSSVEKQR